MGKESLFEKLRNLSSGQKKLLAYVLIGVLVLAFGIFQYSTKKPRPQKKETLSFKDIVPEVGILEKSLYEESTRKAEQLERSLLELRKELAKTKKELTRLQEEQERTTSLEKRLGELEKQFRETKGRIRQIGKAASPEGKKKPAEVGRREGVRTYTYPAPPAGVQKTPPPKKGIEWKGGILRQKGAEAKREKVGKTAKAEEKKSGFAKTVYLPPSFVPADLLTGFAAFTSEAGKKEPLRALFRLKDLAVLPNEVKSDLKGCFVIGEAYGSLADERTHVRLLRLSCIARDGSSVIDEKVTGYVVDEDGKVGLKGRVVTKMGAILARGMLAGFFEGFGEAYSSSQYSITYTGTGVVQLPSPAQAAEIGAGKGIAKIGKTYSDIYKDLLQQTFPVIEIGAGRSVTVVFDKGVELHIKKVCLKGGRDGCRECKASDALSALAGLP